MVAIQSLRVSALIVILVVLAVICEILSSNDELRNIRCYPSHFDMKKIYSSLSRLINYMWDNRSAIELTEYVGLFLTRVHLRSAFALCNHIMYSQMNVNIFELISNVTLSIDFFASQFIGDKSVNLKVFVHILELFLEDGTWYDGNLEMKMNSVSTFDDKTGDYFNAYIKDVYNFPEIEPSYHYLEKCLAHLSNTKYQFPNGTKGCPLSWVCHAIFKPNPTGPQALGFSLTNKVALLLMSKYSRSCNVTIFREEMLENFCDKMFVEAIMNYKNKCPLLNLMSEQMAVCSMYRKGDMLFKEWLFILMDQQVDYGCLRGNTYSREYHSDKLDEFGFYKFNPYGSLPNNNQGVCNRHLTTTYMVALAGAFRFVIQAPDQKQQDICRFFYTKISNEYEYD